MPQRKKTSIYLHKLLTKLYHSFYPKYLLAIISIVGGYLCIYALFHFFDGKDITICLFKQLIGYPCPGCGMGRASNAILNGDLFLSLKYNILGIPFSICICVSLFWLIKDIIKKENFFFEFLKRDLKNSYKIILLILILTSWIINIIRQI